MENVVLYRLKNGKTECQPFAKWQDGKITISQSDISDYQIKFNKVDFKDVSEKEWYYKAINAIAAREIINGVGHEKFAPGEDIKRADFLIMVMKTFGVEPSTTAEDNFADAGEAYYTNYLAKAKELGFVNGTGNNRFSPKERISRQDMFVILYSVMSKLNKISDTTLQKTEFKDKDTIAGYAKDAIEYLAGTGMISGWDGKVNAKEHSKRGEVAQILYNLIMK